MQFFASESHKTIGVWIAVAIKDPIFGTKRGNVFLQHQIGTFLTLRSLVDGDQFLGTKDLEQTVQLLTRDELVADEVGLVCSKVSSSLLLLSSSSPSRLSTSLYVIFYVHFRKILISPVS